MYRIHATGGKLEIEQAWSILAWTDPSPADAVDYREDGRTRWRLDAYAADKDAAEACRALVADTVPALSVRVDPLEDRDWVAMSLEGLPSIRAGTFLVAGAHSLPKVRTGLHTVQIEAGPAFGTGHHGTTLGCLLALDTLLRGRRPGNVLDVGTGTGVLAIAALKAGARRVVGTDIHPGSIETARENALLNDVNARFKSVVARGVNNIRLRRMAPYDLILANILARPLIGLATHLPGITAPGGHIVLSGLLTRQAPLVSKAYASRGLLEITHIRRDGWSTLVFQRSPFPRGA
ncbi:MAG: 50S ribosomal protein L11 methyltransferase [Pseudomonadota bacterium]